MPAGSVEPGSTETTPSLVHAARSRDPLRRCAGRFRTARRAQEENSGVPGGFAVLECVRFLEFLGNKER